MGAAVIVLLAALGSLAEDPEPRRGETITSEEATAPTAPETTAERISPETTSAPATPPPTQDFVAGGSNCHPAYPDDCIPPPPPDLDCGDINRRVRVDHRHGDPHGFDASSDGWGCESYG